MARQYTKRIFTAKDRERVDFILRAIFSEDRTALEEALFERAEHPEYFWEGWDSVSDVIEQDDNDYWNYATITKPSKKIPFGGLHIFLTNRNIKKRTITFYMVWKVIDGEIHFANPLLLDASQLPWAEPGESEAPLKP